MRKEAERELTRLERLPAAAPDFQVTRTYLELMLELPWKKTTEDVIDLAHARQVLDEDHFGLEEVKERILEDLAVLKLNPKAKAPILCLVGPPGVGKTSLGQSIARALGRKFERMSLGGLHDEAELRGHRRTYIGAMPGRILQATAPGRRQQPGADARRGRQARPRLSAATRPAALLEVLDPAQNGTFRDNYLDLPFDLSKVLFITTANTPGHDSAAAAGPHGGAAPVGLQRGGKGRRSPRRYLLPRQLKETGLTRGAADDPARDAAARHRPLHARGRRARAGADAGPDRPQGGAAVRRGPHRAGRRSAPADLADLLGPERVRPERYRQESASRASRRAWPGRRRAATCCTSRRALLPRRPAACG